MKNLTEKEQKLVDELRSLQVQYAIEDEERFQQLLSRLCIIDDGRDQSTVDHLFNYIYNSPILPSDR